MKSSGKVKGHVWLDFCIYWNWFFSHRSKIQMQRFPLFLWRSETCFAFKRWRNPKRRTPKTFANAGNFLVAFWCTFQRLGLFADSSTACLADRNHSNIRWKLKNHGNCSKRHENKRRISTVSAEATLLHGRVFAAISFDLGGKPNLTVSTNALLMLKHSLAPGDTKTAASRSSTADGKGRNSSHLSKPNLSRFIVVRQSQAGGILLVKLRLSVVSTKIRIWQNLVVNHRTLGPRTKRTLPKKTLTYKTSKSKLFLVGSCFEGFSRKIVLRLLFYALQRFSLWGDEPLKLTHRLPWRFWRWGFSFFDGIQMQKLKSEPCSFEPNKLNWRAVRKWDL